MTAYPVSATQCISDKSCAADDPIAAVDPNIAKIQDCASNCLQQNVAGGVSFAQEWTVVSLEDLIKSLDQLKSLPATPHNQQMIKELCEKLVEAPLESFTRELTVVSLDVLFKTLDLLESLPATPHNQQMIEEIFDKISEKPISLELLKNITNRKGKPICAAERALLTRLKRQLPELNKALISHELLSRETRKMDLTRFREITIESAGHSYKAYDTDGTDYQFLIHAAGISEGDIEEVKQKRMRSGFLCTSLVSNDAGNYFHPKRNYAMVLEYAPGTLVATNREDTFSPYRSLDPKTLEYYRLNQRFQLLTGYIDHLYRESGIQGEHSTDDLSRLNRLSSSLIQDDESRKTIKQLRNKLPVQKKWISLEKLEALILFYHDQPEKLVEIIKCKEFLQEISHLIFSEGSVPCHPILGTGEILSQTGFQPEHIDNEMGNNPYNELDLDLVTFRVPSQDPVQVRAILIDRSAFLSAPEKYHELLENAERHRLPILLRTRPPLPMLSMKKRHN